MSPQGGIQVEDRHDGAVDPVEQRIVDAARQLLRAVGESFTMEQLERRAGISRATIYRRIGTKQKLLERLARSRGESFARTGTRRRILEAARPAIAREGLAAVTMEQIADEADLGVATVYRHFGDKDSLFRAFAEEMTPRGAIRSLALHPSADVEADLETIVGTLVPFFSTHRDLFRLMMLGSETDRRYLEHLREGSDSTFTRLTDFFALQLEAGRLRRAAGPEELALALLGTVLAFTVIGPLHYGSTLSRPERTSGFIVELFLDGLRGEGS